MNPCPCGFYGNSGRECTCSPTQVSRYSKRISGPLMDRIDIFVEVPRVDYEKLAGPAESESSGHVRLRTRAPGSGGSYGRPVSGDYHGVRGAVGGKRPTASSRRPADRTRSVS